MSNLTSPLVGIDWGTSNRRAYVLDAGGTLIRQHADGFGILNVAGNFDASLRKLLQQLDVQPHNILMSGMVGSRNGWRETPYLAIDYPLSELPDAAVGIETSIPDVRCRIVPGYQCEDPHGLPDV